MPNGGQDLAQPAERQDDRERADTIWGGERYSMRGPIQSDGG